MGGGKRRRGEEGSGTLKQVTVWLMCANTMECPTIATDFG